MAATNGDSVFALVPIINDRQARGKISIP